ncbi:amidase signature enzyme [Penicillium argentinense]|uniref:Amidase signature enzyme n=1 Tax=Penicillium argentinense TaxID=1131581 RepID=A0A9W9G2Q4_9EURO|nr:amidase signature enzyme [Penicillium argentinense]KAJ5110901.1 amidase signature enzyme [Penicillium argentinense]
MATCENFCNSTSSYTSGQGVVENPYAAGYSAGGTPPSVAALLGAGHIDIGLGVDRSGSIRIPSSLTGYKFQVSLAHSAHSTHPS